MTFCEKGRKFLYDIKEEPMKSKMYFGYAIGLFCVIFAVGTPLLGVGAGACMRYYPGVIHRMEKCHLASEMLGSDIGVSPVGLSCGSAKTQGAYGRATWRLPVSGSKDSGTDRFFIERRGGAWVMISGVLSVGGKDMDVVGCRYVVVKESKEVR